MGMGLGVGSWIGGARGRGGGGGALGGGGGGKGGGDMGWGRGLSSELFFGGHQEPHVPVSVPAHIPQEGYPAIRYHSRQSLALPLSALGELV